MSYYFNNEITHKNSTLKYNFAIQKGDNVNSKFDIVFLLR